MSSTTSAAKSILPGYVSPCHQFLKLATNKGGLYESGDHSDLLVRSQDGREFRVHKCIVASKSGFFKGACRGGFKAQSGVIEVEEDGEVMDALFRHIYEAPIEWLPTGADTNDVLSEKATVQTLLLTKKLRAASEKYLVAGLGRGTSLAFVNCLSYGRRGPMVELVQMCRVILYEEVSIGKFARYKALGALGCTMPKIVKDTAAWAALSSDQILLRAATACAISWSDLCATRSEDQERAQKERKIVRLIAGFVWPQDEPDPSDEQLKDLVKYNRDLLGELRGS